MKTLCLAPFLLVFALAGPAYPQSSNDITINEIEKNDDALRTERNPARRVAIVRHMMDLTKLLEDSPAMRDPEFRHLVEGMHETLNASLANELKTAGAFERGNPPSPARLLDELGDTLAKIEAETNPARRVALMYHVVDIYTMLEQTDPPEDIREKLRKGKAQMKAVADEAAAQLRKSEERKSSGSIVVSKPAKKNHVF